MIGQARVPGTCGELVQGVIDGRHTHVTCPVALYSTATVEIAETPGVSAPEGAVKAEKALAAMLSRFANGRGANLSIESDLPVGKGMASSTADIAATCWAAASALGIDLPADVVAEISLEIEPTDGVLFPGIVAFDHEIGGTPRHLGSIGMDVVVLEPTGGVDTLNYSGRRPIYDDLELSLFKKAYAMVLRGIETGDPGLVGAGATLSSRINQRFLPKPRLEELIELVLGAGALGVNVAHSGTVVGVLAELGSGEGVAEQLQAWAPDDYRIHVTKITDGGPISTEAERPRVRSK